MSMHKRADPRASAPGRGPAITDRQAWIGVLAVSIVGAALIAWGLDGGLWYDEIATLIDSVRRPLGSIVTHFPGDNDHLAYSVLARLSIVLLGEHPWSLRLPAALFGVASIPMLFVLGRGVTSRFEALLAATILAVSYHQVWFAQNARAYTMMLFFTLLGTHLLLTGLRSDRRAAWLGYGVAAACAAYAHLTMVLLAFTQGLVVVACLWSRQDARFNWRTWRNPALGFGLAALLTLILYAPLLTDVHAFFGSEGRGAGVSTGSGVILGMLAGLGLVKTAAALGILVVCAVGLWSYARQRPAAPVLFFLPILAILAVTIVLNRPIRPRFFFFSAGFLLLIAVRGALVTGDEILRRASFLGARLRALAPVLIGAAMVVVSAWSLPYLYSFPKQDLDGALRYVEARRAVGDGVYTIGIGAEYPYQRYYGRAWPRLRTPAELDAARARDRAVWVLYTFPSYLDAQVPDLMADLSAHCEKRVKFWGTLEDGVVYAVHCR